MNLARRTLEQNRSGLPSKVHDEPRILIVCDDNSETARLTAVLRSAGIFSDGAGSIAEGCEAAKSGRFQVVVSTPLLRDTMVLVLRSFYGPLTTTSQKPRRR